MPHFPPKLLLARSKNLKGKTHESLGRASRGLLAWSRRRPVLAAGEPVDRARKWRLHHWDKHKPWLNNARMMGETWEMAWHDMKHFGFLIGCRSAGKAGRSFTRPGLDHLEWLPAFRRAGWQCRIYSNKVMRFQVMSHETKEWHLLVLNKFCM